MSRDKAWHVGLAFQITAGDSVNGRTCALPNQASHYSAQSIYPAQTTLTPADRAH